MKTYKTIFLFFISLNIFALVDYSEPEDQFTPRSSGARSIQKKAPPAMRKVAKSPYQSSGMFDLSSSYQMEEVRVGSKSGKRNMANFNAHFDTGKNIFMDLAYSTSSSNNLTEKESFQKGNPLLTIGFNWLEFGGGTDRGNIDFIGGVSLAAKNSDFATSRTDKILGVESAKRFQQFAVGFGYQYHLTGSPEEETEYDIGNISILKASLGWMISGDIRTKVEAATVKVGRSNEPDRSNRVDEKLSFGYVKPVLQLGITPTVNLDLGAVFRTKKIQNEDYLNAKLWQLTGSYGNSIFAGLLVAI